MAKGQESERQDKVLAQDEKASPRDLSHLAAKSTELARLVASNYSAPANLLEKLSKSRDTEILKRVTSNPNTPPDVLMELVGEFPDQLLENPAIDFLFLENPDLLEDMSTRTIHSLLRSSSASEQLISSACSYPDMYVRESLAGDRQIQDEVLKRLALDRRESVRNEVAANPSTPAGTLYQLAGDVSKYVRHSVAKNRSAPVEALNQLSNDNYSPKSAPESLKSIDE